MHLEYISHQNVVMIYIQHTLKIYSLLAHHFLQRFSHNQQFCLLQKLYYFHVLNLHMDLLIYLILIHKYHLIILQMYILFHNTQLYPPFLSICLQIDTSFQHLRTHTGKFSLFRDQILDLF